MCNHSWTSNHAALLKFISSSNSDKDRQKLYPIDKKLQDSSQRESLSKTFTIYHLRIFKVVNLPFDDPYLFYSAILSMLSPKSFIKPPLGTILSIHFNTEARLNVSKWIVVFSESGGENPSLLCFNQVALFRGV